MAHTVCEMMWLKNLIMEFGFRQRGPMPMHCGNQSTIYIDQNLVFHERTKHIEINYHLIRDALTKKVVSLSFTPSSKHLAYLFTKAASPHVFSNLCSKLCMIDIYAPTWMRVLVLDISYWVIGLWPLHISIVVLYIYWLFLMNNYALGVYLLIYLF